MLILFLIVFINLVGFGIIIPLLPFYGEHFNASPDEVTLLMAVYSLTQFVTAPFWGRWSDQYGRRPILLISLGGTVVAYVWMALANDLASLFWARALGGVMAGSISASFAYAADITTEENRAKGMGLIGAAFGLGFIAGPAIGGLLAGGDPSATNFQLPSYAAAGFSFASLLLALFILKESLSPEMRARIASRTPRQRWDMFSQTIARPDVRLTLILTFMAIFAFAGLEATFAMWTERQFGWGVRENGYIFAFIGAFTALIQGAAVGPMAKRIGEMAMIRQGFVALGIGLVVLPFAENLTLLIIALAITGYGFAIATPALNSLLSLQVDAELRGSVLGIGRSVSTLARVGGPASAGYIFVLLGRDWPFFAGAGLMALVLIISYLFNRRATETKAH